MTIEILKDQANGMLANRKKLRENEAVFLKAQGINETIVKTELARDKNIDLLEAKKEILKGFKAKKAKSVSGAAKKIIDKLNEVLPEKNAVFDCTDGLVMGMRNEDGSVTSYNGLSGGQLMALNAAMSNVLDANILIIEGAEIDDIRLAALMEDLVGSDKQVIINTCHASSVDIPGQFQMVEL